MTRVLIESRSVWWALSVAVAMWVLSVVVGGGVIHLTFAFPPTKAAIVELCAIVTATVLAILTRPRFWEWDRVARNVRPRVVAGAVAAAVIGLSVACVPAVVPRLPDNTAWTWVLANALVVSATVLLLSPLLTPLVAGGVTAVLWFGAGVTTNLAPGIWLPLTDYREQDGHWVVGVVLVVAAIAVHVRTCGMSGWAHRRE